MWTKIHTKRIKVFQTKSLFSQIFYFVNIYLGSYTLPTNLTCNNLIVSIKNDLITCNQLDYPSFRHRHQSLQNLIFFPFLPIFFSCFFHGQALLANRKPHKLTIALIKTQSHQKPPLFIKVILIETPSCR